jgi:trk system potassium uptake protein TrkA
MGTKRIVAKALTEDHAKILESVGATETIYPEKDMAIKTALKLSCPNVLEYLPLISGFGIQEIAPPEKFIGKNLRELDLRNKYGIQVIAIKELIPEKTTFVPKADFVLKDSDILVIMGEDKQLEKIGAL